ncbi:LPS-assembly protein LptD [Arsukibacterium sp.]|uniref:LPS-assembly protein LptD n=1 Tax=Arsukibacterium sp. TaxID=1977258 RepID=UPI002FDB8C5B
MKHSLGWAVICWAGLSSATPQAEENTVLICYQPIKLPDTLAQLDPLDQRIRISSEQVELDRYQNALFSGTVELTHRDTLLRAPLAALNSEQQRLSAEGGIEYINTDISVASSSFSADLQSNEASLTDASYRFNDQAGRGHARTLVASEQQLQLSEALFTTCPVDDNSWALHADNISINSDDGWGEARNAVFRIKDIPVLYLPYLTFPVNDQRKSGLLLPKISSSQKLGVELELPYYLNLAENYDLTLTPRYMSKRGTQLKSEFRYLTAAHQGQLQLEYLPSDNDKPANFGSRYLGHLSNRSDFSSRVRGYIDVTGVGDDGYLSELGSAYNNQSDTQLYRDAALSYYGENIHSQLRVQGFQILGNYDKAYTTLPELTLSAARPLPLLSSLEFDWRAQYAHFRNEQAFFNAADRFHLEPSLRLPFITPALEATAETSLIYTHYQQQSRNELSAEQQTIDRVVPKVRLHAKLNLEREYNWFGEPALHTLEPQIQYLYIPFRDQSHIGLYDSTRLQDDYYGLFRQNRFSGLDRINEANQVTVGWTTRLYDNTDNELFRFSLGQIFFLDSPKPEANEQSDDIRASESMLASELIWHWYRRWYFNAAVQYDAKTRQLIKSQGSLDYRGSEKTLFQLNHRYSQSVSGVEIQQLGVLGAVPLSEQWHLIGSYYRDVTNHRMIDANLGLQYESCCWAVRLVAKRQIQTNFDSVIDQVGQLSQLDTSISLQFVLKGFGDKAGFGVTDMLSNGIFSYRRPYLLTN